MATLTKLTIGIILSFLLYSCNIVGIQGNGNVTTQDRDITSSFNKIDAGYGLDVVIKQGQTNTVTVEADENLQEHIIVRVNNNTLHIETDANIGYAERKLVKVTYENLSKVNVNSGANLENVGALTSELLEIKTTSGGFAKLELDCKTLEAKATSGGVLKLTGNSDNVDVRATSGANLNAIKLLAKNVNAKATTGANLNVYANSTFTGSASTGGNVKYKGDPKTVSIKKGDKTGGNVSKM